LVLRRIVLAAVTTFQLQGACGIRPIGTFSNGWAGSLRRFLAWCAAPLAAQVESDLVAFRDTFQPALAGQIEPRTIT